MTIAVTEDKPPEEQRRWNRQRKGFGEHVAKTVGTLQSRFLQERPDPDAVSALARLRRGIGREPGFDYTLDAYLQVPGDLLGARSKEDDEASDTEYAMHAAVTFYALHQQARREPMHVNHRGLGLAIAELTRASSGAAGVRRRFAALGTAVTYQEALHHLRGLTQLLRDHRIPIDYGLLADDLRTLRRPGGRAQIQSVWGREFFRSKPSRSDDSTTDPSEENN